MFVADEAHVTNIAVHPTTAGGGIATRLLGRPRRRRHRPRLRGMDARGARVSSHGAQALYRAFGFAPPASAASYYENTEDAIVMWCHDIQAPAYADALAEDPCR